VQLEGRRLGLGVGGPADSEATRNLTPEVLLVLNSKYATIVMADRRADCRRWCCPHSTVAVTMTCLLVILGYCAILIFGRSLTATVQSTIGIVVSVETLLAVWSERYWMLRWYALYMVLNTVVSIAIGATLLSGIDLECASALNSINCAYTRTIYALSMALGSSSVGLFAAVNSMVVYYTLPRPAPDTLAAKLAL
jgi:hypothetical protein